ncbi:hypothetical protein ACQY0O_004406 [Thecaphora frezii]|nr:putative endo-beta-mannosidase [Thecaphora frezii]
MKLDLASSALLALALPAGTWAATVTERSHSYSPIDATDFVRVDGLRLKDSHNQTTYLHGINYWACMNLAADGKYGGEHKRFITELDQMAAKGINHLRIMASSEGNPTPQPFRMSPALQQAPGEYNEGIFVGLDRCLAEMAKRGMRATMTLNDQWQWSGGFAQYISWANNNEAISYPPSWNLTAPPQRPGKSGRGWGNYTTTGTFSDYVDYGNQIYTNAQAEEWFKAHIEKVLNRKNTVNGRIYKDDATIMTWQLANEPQPANQAKLYGRYSLELGANPTDPLFAWIDRISSFIKERAPKQLISLGFEGKQGEWYFKHSQQREKAIDGSTPVQTPEGTPKGKIDYATCHAWVQNWGVYDMLNSSSANLEAAKDFATEFLGNVSRWSTEIGKPVLLEEFGMARDNWQNNVAKGEYQYASKATTTHKDAYFKHIFDFVRGDFEKGGPFIGQAPWAYGGVYRPETQKANKFGMVWAGDPPHEAPGWYDVYDADEALNIVSRQRQSLDKLLKKENK